MLIPTCRREAGGGGRWRDGEGRGGTAAGADDVGEFSGRMFVLRAGM